MSLLKTKDINLFDTQKQVIKDLLEGKRKAGEIKSDEEYEVEYATMLAKIEAGEPTLKVREQIEETDADKINASYEEFQIDIMSAFSQINKVDQTVSRHQQLNQGIINNLKLTVKKIGDSMRRYERLADYRSSEEIVMESFRDSNSIEGDELLYTERDGSLVPAATRAHLDIDREALRLPVIYAHNKLIGNSGIRLGSIHITKQLGGGLIRIQNPENKVEKAIDTSMETFWSETIMVDSPIRVEMGPNFYDIKRGAMCELLVVFDTMSQVNQLSFTPFTEFPMQIVAVQYYQGDDVNEAPREIIAPQLASRGLGSQSTTEPIVYQFNDIQAKRIRIILNQVHYTKTDFVADDKASEQLMLWFSSKEEVDPRDVVAQTKWYYGFKPLYANKAERKRGYHYFSKALAGIDPGLDSLVGEKEVKTATAVSKYSYSYGLYNLGITQNAYHNVGVYVSKPMLVEGNIKSIGIETEEEHPYVAADIAPFTDIEYYITNMETPNNDEWYPIMPSNKTRIDSELLAPVFDSGRYKAKLRFLPDTDDYLLVRKDGVEIWQEWGDYVVQDDVITIHNYDPSSLYTCTYRPVEESQKIDFVAKHTIAGVVVPNRSVEEYHGTNSNAEIELNYYPFTDKNKLNAQPTGWNPSFLSNEFLPITVKVILPTGFHIDQPFSEKEQDTVVIVNRTDYFNPTVGMLEPFNPETFNYQYMVAGKKILFNTKLPADARIIVEYPYIVGKIRMKAILRRTLNYFYGLSPILKEYTVKYQRLL